MSLIISSLNSGSNGNCYYIGNDQDAILVDAGISCRETEKRMKRIGLSISKVRALFISHEHGDHIAGVVVLAKKHSLPVYITSPTRTHGRLVFEATQAIHFKAFEPIIIGSLCITAFPKFHDAADPHSFIIEHKGITVGVFTDIGRISEHVIEYFKKCHAIFLETNYDTDMLDKGSYPYHLKNRIRGGEGHLSNEEAFMLFKAHRPHFMSHVFLSHLSKNNNTPEIAAALFAEHAGNTEIVVASRYKETGVYHITGEMNPLPQTTTSKKSSSKKEQQQLSLF